MKPHDRQRHRIAFGNALRAARYEARRTQDQVAADVGVTRYTYTRWENGRRTPTTEYIPAVAAAVNARYDDLFGGCMNPEQRALASLAHIARTGGAWGAFLAAIKTGQLLNGKRS